MSGIPSSTAPPSRWQIVIDGRVLGRGTKLPLRAAPRGLGFGEVRSSDVESLTRPGGWALGDSAGWRDIEIPLWVLGDSPEEAWLLTRELAAVCAPRSVDVPVGVCIEGEPLVVWARPRRCEIDGDRIGRSSRAAATIQLRCTDPRLWSWVEHTASIRLRGDGTAGVIAPIEAPLTFATVDAQVLLIENRGTTASPPLVCIAGPVSHPVVSCNGDTFGVDVEVDAGSVLEIDMLERTVRLDGASRVASVDVSSTWFELRPGMNRIVWSHNGVYDPEARLTVVWRDAWW
jgi:hypothetical protein